MSQRIQNTLLIVIGLIAFVLLFATFIIREGETAIVIRLGKIQSQDLKSGLHFKIPLFDKVDRLDARLQTFNVKPEEVLTAEKKYLVVDYFVEWRLGESGKYYIRTRGNTKAAENLIDQVSTRIVRGEFAKRDVKQVIKEDRIQIREDITQKLNQELQSEGIEIVDVRIKRVEFADSIKESVYQRMKSERLRISNKFRAEGREDAAKIRAETDREASVINATARKEAEIIRGQGEAEAIKTYADAFGQDMEFYRFQKTLEAYESAFNDQNDLLITRPDSQFFDYLRSTAP